MASTKKAQRKPPADDGLVVVTQRLYVDDVEALKRLGVEARMPWGEVLRRLVHEALPRAKATVAGVTFKTTGRIE